MRRVFPVAAFAALALAAPVAGQSAPNLSGTWTLQVDKSDFGMMPGPTSRTDVIDHQEPKLTIKRTVVSAAGETMTMRPAESLTARDTADPSASSPAASPRPSRGCPLLSKTVTPACGPPERT